jgi:hypothetical protein
MEMESLTPVQRTAERQAILSDATRNGSAQIKFGLWIDDLLAKKGREENGAPHIRDLDCPDSLEGSLDLSVLETKGLRHIESLTFANGKLVACRHLPTTLRVFQCLHNLLTDLDDLSSSLKELNVEGNLIHQLDLSRTPNLRYLNANDNRLMQLDGLPVTLEELYLDHNQLSRLDLDGLDRLKKLHVSHNQLMVIDHLPKGTEVVMEHNPLAQINRTQASNKERTTPKSSSAVDYWDALNKYMELKHQYETSVRQYRKRHEERMEKQRRQEKNPAATSGSGSKKQKRITDRVAVPPPPFPPCLHCRRNVGMKFSKKGRTYLAVCGDTSAPCVFHMELESAVWTPPILVESDETRRAWQTSKERLMAHKMDTLFRYISDAASAEKFKPLLDDYLVNNEHMQHVTDRYAGVYNNPLRAELIRRKTDAIHATMKSIRVYLAEYERDPTNRGPLILAIRTIKDDLLPAQLSLRQAKYEITEVETTLTPQGNFKENLLVQYEHHPVKIATTELEPPKVIVYRGV